MKILFSSKIKIVTIIVLLFTSSNLTFSQAQQPILLTGSELGQTHHEQAESLYQRLIKIADFTGNNIVFDTDMVDAIEAPPIVNLENKNIIQILSESLNGSGLTYKALGNGSFMIIEIPSKVSLEEQSTLSGSVVDEYGDPLVGALVKITPGDYEVYTDNNGDFSIEIPSGVYNVEISYINFITQRLENVPANPGVNTPLNIVLEESLDSRVELEGIVVTAQYKTTASTNGLLMQQKKAAQMSDGISAEQIAKTPDSNIGSTLKRITGLTTLDNKFVVVRSMEGRWNQAVMDGINLPSTDAHQSHFSFNIIPTPLVESVVVSKTITPDMNASFTGGHVEVKTKDIPKEDFTTFSFSNSFNDRSTFKDQVTKQRGKYDFLGFDDGTREDPHITSIPSPTTEEEAGPFIAESKKFKEDNFTNYTTSTPLNSAYQFSIGRAYKLENNNKWGFVGALTLRNTQEALTIEHTERGKWMPRIMYISAQTDEEGNPIGYGNLNYLDFSNSGKSYTYESNLAAVFNAGIQLGKHRITTRNIYSRLYNNQLTQITGWNYYYNDKPFIEDGSEPPMIETTNYPVFQDFLQNKIEGSYKSDNWEVNWFGARNYIKKDTKDATYYNIDQLYIGDDIYQYFHVSNKGKSIERHFNWNTETDYNWGANLKWSFNLGNTRNDIKTGYFGTIKKAENKRRKYRLYNLKDNPLNAGTSYSFAISEILDGTHYYWSGSEYGGFGWDNYDYFGDKYEGKVDIHSAFLMFDNKLTKWFRLVWGLRAEYYVYKQLQSQTTWDLVINDSISHQALDNKKWQYMPSVNLTLSPTNRMNIRLSYFKTATRPQFAEQLRLPYYDPVRSVNISTDPYRGGVVSSISNSYDFKFEWFPSLGEILSASVYYKEIDEPIESVGRAGLDGQATTVYILNSKSAKLWGLEAEVRKSLNFLGEGKALDNLFIFGNGTLNFTKVVGMDFKRDENNELSYITYDVNRPLAGQSPYAYNIGLEYNGERLGFSILQNGVGDQYLLVASQYFDEEIRMPYSNTDAQIRWRFLKEKNLEVKFNAKNIFDTAIKTYNNRNSYTKVNPNYVPGVDNIRNARILREGTTDRYDENIDEVLFEAYRGVTLSLGFSYSF